MRNVSDKSCRENQNTFCVRNFFFFEKLAIFEIMWKIIAQPRRPQMTIWRMRIACWITKPTDIHSEYVTLTAVRLQHWLQERASILRLYRSADKFLARPGRKQANVCVRMAWMSFGALPCRKKKLMIARVSMLLKSRATPTCFRACFLPGRAKDLSAARYVECLYC